MRVCGGCVDVASLSLQMWVSGWGCSLLALAHGARHSMQHSNKDYVYA